MALELVIHIVTLCWINVSVSTFMHQGQDIVVEVVFIPWRQHGRMVRALDLKSGGRFLTTSWWCSQRSWVRFLSCWSVHFSHFITELKTHDLYSFITLTMTTTVLIVAVCRTPVTYLTQLNDLDLNSTSSRTSVDRAPAQCSGGHGFDSCRWFRFCFVPRSCRVDQFTFHISFRSFPLSIFPPL